MRKGKAAVRAAAISAALALSACATWFVPESRSRGDIFDAASRDVIPLDEMDVRRRLDALLLQAGPPGSAVADVEQHIVGAGGDCAPSNQGWAKPGFERTVCAYRRDIYFAKELVFLDDPAYWLTRNVWTVNIAHADGVVGWYVLEGQAMTERLDREDYLEKLGRQRALEEADQQTTNED